jgi:steroid 5-alpha reductase family enzyme
MTTLAVTAFLPAMGGMLALSVAGWVVSLARRNVNLADSLWSLFFLAGAVIYASRLETLGPRAVPILILLALWALRLSVHLAWRNWGKPEDRRYQAIRANNSPGFAWKSLFIVFWLQAILASVIALPVFTGLATTAPLNILDALGATLALAGLIVESWSDHQLAQFKADPANRARVMDLGLWRYSRHPNYFGEACLWWGFGLSALAGGAGWTLVSPVLMTFLLLRVSGVTLLEKEIDQRRPAYRDYVARTSAFIPWLPQSQSPAMREEPR